MGDFNGHHTLWGCEDVNNRGQQWENLILKNSLILYNDIYFYSAFILAYKKRGKDIFGGRDVVESFRFHPTLSLFYLKESVL